VSRLVGFVGSRSLPASFSPHVSSLVASFLARGFRVASGGAVGADQFALSALVEQGASSSGVVFSAWSSVGGFPASVRPSVDRFLASGGQVVWGASSPGAPRQQVVSALLGRNQRLVSACSCLVAFLHGPSRGTLFTVRQAVRRGIPVHVFLCGGGASLPADLSTHCLVKEVV
jgi:predicted Rossmann fold nucleotide-binding protein DprA/Smf involved in DNA uptake